MNREAEARGGGPPPQSFARAGCSGPVVHVNPHAQAGNRSLITGLARGVSPLRRWAGRLVGSPSSETIEKHVDNSGVRLYIKRLRILHFN